MAGEIHPCGRAHLLDLFDQYADATDDGYWKDDSKRAALAIIEALQHELQEHGAAGVLAAPAPDHVARELAAVQPPLPKERRVGRRDDMSTDGKLHVMLQEDGDVCVQVVKGATSANMCDFQQADIEFCSPGSGGGRSPRTREALVALMLAIEADNAERPIPPAGVPVRDAQVKAPQVLPHSKDTP